MSDDKFPATFQSYKKRVDSQEAGIIKRLHLFVFDVCLTACRLPYSLPFVRRRVIYHSIALLGLISLIVLALGCSGDSSSSNLETQVCLAINDLHSELQKKLGKPIPPLSVFVQTPTESVFSSAANTLEEAITPDTYFRIASITKNITGTAILLMKQYGWLEISHTITTIMPGGDQPYVPDTPDYAIPNKEEITIEQLLQHTAGVYDVDNDPSPDPDCKDKTYDECKLDQDPDYQFTAAEIVRQDALYGKSSFPPGTDYGYSDTGYTLLGEIISRVYSFHAKKEKTYSDFILEHVMGTRTPYPLAMVFPYLGTNQTMPSPYVCGTVFGLDGDRVYCRDNMSAYVANGNGLGTLRQLNTFVRTLMRSENLLSRESVALMQNDTSSFNPDYGLGCKRWQYLGYGHKGDHRGYTTIMAYNPETEVSIVVLLPLWDERSEENFAACQITLFNAAFATLKVLGYPAETLDHGSYLSKSVVLNP
jgi:D-alanyl-D-alanine carboxypeptidase